MINNPSLVLSMKPEFIIDASLSEIIGRAGIAAALELVRMTQVSSVEGKIKSEKGSDLLPLETALETLYGSPVCAGIAHRAGQVSFKYFLTVFGKKLGFSDIDFRLLPMNQRKYKGLCGISEEMLLSYGLRSIVRDQKSLFLVEIENCPECKGEDSQRPTCHFITGFLQEYLAWMGGGRFYNVRETSCIAGGGTCCTFELAKKPLD
jgi:predicted hydrocarbon binding protein